MRAALRWALAAFFVGAGVSHFTATAFFVQIVPPWVPAPLAVVWISGVAEIVLGLLILPRATRRLAGWGLVALLLAVFPANAHMATTNLQLHDPPAWMGQPTPTQLWLRLPLQLVLIAWAWWATRR
jgi:uncharacterized membrane protein